MAAVDRTREGLRVVGVGLCAISAALAWRIGMLLFTEHYNSYGWDVSVGAAPRWVFLSAGVALTLLGLFLLRGGQLARPELTTSTWRTTAGFALICAVTGFAAAYLNTAPDDSGTVGPDLQLVVSFAWPVLVGFGCYRLIARPAGERYENHVQRWRVTGAWAAGVVALGLSFWMNYVR